MEAARLWARRDFLQEDDQVKSLAEVDKALAMFGLVAEQPVHAPIEQFYLWPENVPAWQLFMACGNRWRSGMAGRDGLDAYGVEVEMRLHRVRPRQRRQRWAEIKAMESEALKAWAEQEAAKKKR